MLVPLRCFLSPLFRCVCVGQDLFPGLNERPPHAEILTRAFDMLLPAIDPEEQVGKGPASQESEEGEEGDVRGADSDEVRLLPSRLCPTTPCTT